MTYRGPRLAIEIPETHLTRFLLDGASRWFDKAAFVDGPTGRTLTYGQWAEGVRRGARGLVARGFRKGDVFAMSHAPAGARVWKEALLAGEIDLRIWPVRSQFQRPVEQPLRTFQIALVATQSGQIH